MLERAIKELEEMGKYAEELNKMGGDLLSLAFNITYGVNSARRYLEAEKEYEEIREREYEEKGYGHY